MNFETGAAVTIIPGRGPVTGVISLSLPIRLGCEEPGTRKRSGGMILWRARALGPAFGARAVLRLRDDKPVGGEIKANANAS